MLAGSRSSWKTALLATALLFRIGVTHADAGTVVKVSWDANTEPDLAGYKVYYGQKSRQYDHVVDVGNITEYEVGNLLPGQTYYFAVTAYDTAGNESAPSEEVSATLPQEDTTPPYMTALQILAKNALLVSFSENITRRSAENVSNYEILGGIRVKAATLKEDGKSVNLVTDDHQDGKSYILRVSGIEDLASPPNVIVPGSQWGYTYTEPRTPGPPPDTLAPYVLNVQVVSNNVLEVVYSEKVLALSAENKANYDLTGNMTIGEARLQSDQRTVRLTTSLHQNGHSYILTVRNIADLAEPPNIMRSPIQWAYTYHEDDREPPKIVDGHLEDITHLHLLFSEPITPESAESRDNYRISDGIVVNSAILQSDQRRVVLVTTPHQLNHQYTLTVNGIRDQSPFQNVIQPNSTFHYVKQGQVPPPEPEKPDDDTRSYVQNLTPSRYQLRRLQAGDAIYIDRETRIVSLPEKLKNLVWIKTAYQDRFNTASDFLTFHLNQTSRVYVAYDARATAWPHWLTSNFTRVPFSIEISENGKYLDIWQADVPAGPVTLGGNAAEGAAGVTHMYVVMVDANPSRSGDGLQPRDYILYQNYPNPFNPRTELSYFLARPSNVELKIYDTRGRLIRVLDAGQRKAGLHRMTWDATNDQGQLVPSGTYFYVLEIKEEFKNGGFVMSRAVDRQKRTMVYIR